MDKRNIEADFKMYVEDPAKWCDRYLNQCSPKGIIMPRIKFVIEFLKGKGKQPYRSRVRSCNGNIVFHSENMTHKAAPVKTMMNFIEAIKKDEFRLDSYTIEQDK